MGVGTFSALRWHSWARAACCSRNASHCRLNSSCRRSSSCRSWRGGRGTGRGGGGGWRWGNRGRRIENHGLGKSVISNRQQAGVSRQAVARPPTPTKMKSLPTMVVAGDQNELSGAGIMRARDADVVGGQWGVRCQRIESHGRGRKGNSS